MRPWPNGERPLTQAELEELQRHLAEAGYYDGEIDGKLGQASRDAIRAYQQGRGLTADGLRRPAVAANLAERVKSCGQGAE